MSFIKVGGDDDTLIQSKHISEIGTIEYSPLEGQYLFKIRMLSGREITISGTSHGDLVERRERAISVIESHAGNCLGNLGLGVGD
ncbi:hypothetical protein SCBWM1_gp143 [Synechococcus phage S-CBWM1]|uniref:Uncharacterized protein n=1 Tax=Synechococcus phage S-CBWM1 TaxID=2053653 RepID=A0A3G1L3T0_9CAUD|nr:hypothetical protein HOU61_gp054 [Synechococcus phage S-CBWM1]ATW62827.1 hypothetical protein SCBWM1_gp143 [Synechococcus phage S-CBWM1]